MSHTNLTKFLLKNKSFLKLLMFNVPVKDSNVQVKQFWYRLLKTRVIFNLY